MTYLKYAGLLLAVAVGLSFQPTAFAQDIVEWQPTGRGNWNVDGNWTGPGGALVPEAEFDEVARINTGGTAQVIDTPPAVGAIAIDNGTVDVTAAGNLTSQVGLAGISDGAVTIADNGTLIVAGTLSVPSLQSSGTVRTVGASSALTVAGNANLGGTFIAELTSGVHGAVGVTGNATLGGPFIADFNGAVAHYGHIWDIIDAGSFTGSFSSVSLTGATLPTGQMAGLQQVAGGSNGNLLQLGIEQRLVLHFDRDTGIASVQNPTTSPISFSMNGYAVESALGSLNPAGWNSLQDQGLDGGSWSETGAGGTINALAELNPTTSTTIAPSQSRPIGSIYAANFSSVVFGQDTEDQLFTYNTPDGQSHQGVVTYSGDKQFNNIVLTVDPATGDATMQNESEISIALDSYTIASDSGALLTTWDSLEDQGVSGGFWLEANPSASRVSEVMSQDFTTLDLNEGFHLDTLFSTGSGQDLTFQFLIAGTSTVFDGVVVFGDLPTNILDPDLNFNEADFNKDGAVDQLDLLAWKDGFGTPAGALKVHGDFDNDGDVDGTDFLGWQVNFGSGSSSGLATAAAVPEPTSLVLLLAGAVGFAGRRRR